MLRLILLVLIMLCPTLSFANGTGGYLQSFLQSREIVGQVDFTKGSDNLSQSTCAKLNALIPRLIQLSKKGYLLRVEGFASPEGVDAQNINLSMSRAMAVRDYFSNSHELHLNIFLTGFGSKETSLAKGKTRRVDIAVYVKTDAIFSLFNDHEPVKQISMK